MHSRREALQHMLEGLHAMKRMAAFGRTGHSEVTHSQWLAITVVARAGEATVKDLRTALRVSSSAATQIVNELVKRGYVRKTSGRTDRRSVSVSLSPKARRALAAMRAQMVERMEQLFSVLNEREFRTFMALHEKVIKGADTNQH